jgi:hypothetical protein
LPAGSSSTTPALFLIFSEEDGLARLFLCLRPLLFKVIHLLQTLHEDEAGHLLDGLERVRAPTVPELVPECVDL